MSLLNKPSDLPEALGIPLSAEQLAAATAPLGPQLIVAGAGTGKTTVMAARVVWLVGSGEVAAHEVLGLTFTRKAAGELRHRIRAGLAKLGPAAAGEHESTVSTYHSFAGSLLTEFSALLGVEADAALLADSQRSRLAYSVACRPADPEGLSGSVLNVAESILAMDDALADLDITTAQLRDFDTALLADLETADGTASLRGKIESAAATRIRVSRLVDQFRAAKASGEYIDFADTVRHAAELASGSALVRSAMTARYRVVLLDEYQDTSRSQRRMLQSLFAGGHAVTAVGDPCQAIYGWRGASVTNIDEFPRNFPAADGREARVDGLTVNRRSGEAVLSAANRVSSGLRAVHTRSQPLVAPATAEPGGLTAALLPTFHDELVWVGDRVADTGARRDWSDIAVLCRTNSQVGQVADELRSRGIPVCMSSRADLLATPEVHWVTSLLQVVVDPFANPELVHHLTGPRWRIGVRDLALLGRRSRDLAENLGGSGDDASLLDAVQDPGSADRYPYSVEARQRFRALRAELDRLGRLAGRPVVEVVSEAVEMLACVLMEPGDRSLPTAVTELLALAGAFRSLGGGRGLSEFVAYLDDCRRFSAGPQSEEPPGGPGVRLMTMHAAKGLEFPVVLVPFLCAGVFPDGSGKSRWPTSAGVMPPVADDEPDIASDLGFPGEGFRTSHFNQFVAASKASERLDEDRLAYVAITRAEQTLFASGHWWGPTQAKPRGPSDYLLAIRAACLDGHGEVGEWCAEAGDGPDLIRVGGEAVNWPLPTVVPQIRDFADLVDAAVGPGDAGDTAVSGAAGAAGAVGPAVGGADSAIRVAAPTRWDGIIAELTTLKHAEATTADAVDLPDLLSVSRMIRLHRDPEAFAVELARPMPPRPSAAADRGTRFHTWVEERMGQQELFDVAEWLGQTNEAAERREFAELFGRTRFADKEPAAVEHPFVVMMDGLVLTGRIDAIFRSDDPDFDWEVVDWKSGSVRRADPLQLVVYRHAWAMSAGCPAERVRAVFVQLSDGSELCPDLSGAAAALAAGAGAGRTGAVRPGRTPGKSLKTTVGLGQAVGVSLRKSDRGPAPMGVASQAGAGRGTLRGG